MGGTVLIFLSGGLLGIDCWWFIADSVRDSGNVAVERCGRRFELSEEDRFADLKFEPFSRLLRRQEKFHG